MKLQWTLRAVIGSLLVMVVQASHAVVVVYDNQDGAFEWTVSVSAPGVDPDYGAFLDITQPPTQSGEQLPGTFGRWLSKNGSSSDPTIRRIAGVGDSKVARLNQETEFEWNNMTISLRPLREYAPGQKVDSDANWYYLGTYYYHMPFSESFSNGTPFISELAYVGVQRVVDGQVNYGWILLKEYTTPVMWAYETEVGVPIQIPIPAAPTGTAALVAAVHLGTRRHRRP